MLQAENSVVLLCRDHAPGAPGIRDLDLDLTLWQPLIEDRAFVPWLVKAPNEQARSGLPSPVSLLLHSVILTVTCLAQRTSCPG